MYPPGSQRALEEANRRGLEQERERLREEEEKKLREEAAKAEANERRNKRFQLINTALGAVLGSGLTLLIQYISKVLHL